MKTVLTACLIAAVPDLALAHGAHPDLQTGHSALHFFEYAIPAALLVSAAIAAVKWSLRRNSDNSFSRQISPGAGIAHGRPRLLLRFRSAGLQ